LTLL
jgi:hypothetical protein